MRCSGGASRDATILQQRARPQRVGPVLDHLRLEFLPADARARIAAHHGLQKRRRQIMRIGPRPRPRHHAGRVVDQLLQQRVRPRRGGDQLPRLGAEPQAELQHVERVLRIAPFRHLVRPRAAELRPAQAFRIVGGKCLRDLAVAPFQPFSRRLPHRPLVPAMHRQQSGDALDHHLAHVVLGLADQRDMRGFFGGERRQPQRLRANPFGAGAGLAGAAAADHQPGVPGFSGWREIGRGLMSVGEDFPMLKEEVDLPQFSFPSAIQASLASSDKRSSSLSKPLTEFFDVSRSVGVILRLHSVFFGAQLAHLGERARQRRQRPRAAFGFGALRGLT